MQSRLIDAPVREVKLYKKQSKIIRKAMVDVEKGSHTFVLNLLSSNIDKASVQVFCKEAMITNIEVIKNYVKVEDDKEHIIALKNDMKTNLQQMRTVETKLSSLQDKKELLQNLLKCRKMNTLDEIESSLDLYEKQLINYETLFLQLQNEQAKLAKENKRLSNALEEIANQEANLVYEIIVSVFVKAKQAINLSYEYISYDAYAPIQYTINLSANGKKSLLQYQSLITQNTKEDWKDVQLTLSSATPIKQHTLLQLKPYYFENVKRNDEDTEVPAFFLKKKVKDYISPMYAEEVVDYSEADLDAFDYTNQEVVYQPNAQEIKFDGVYSIANQTKCLPITFKEIETDFELQYICYGSINKDVYFQAVHNDWLDLDLTESKVNLRFCNEDYGNTLLSLNNIDDLRIPFGIDPSIRINRDIKTKEERKLGKKIITYTCTYEIVNQKDELIPLRIKDQIPLSNTKKISIKLVDSNGAEYEEETGFLSWNIELTQKVKKEFSYTYKVLQA